MPWTTHGAHCRDFPPITQLRTQTFLVYSYRETAGTMRTIYEYVFLSLRAAAAAAGADADALRKFDVLARAGVVVGNPLLHVSTLETW